MDLHAHTAVESFLATAEPVLADDEARHNLVYGICDTMPARRRRISSSTSGRSTRTTERSELR